MAAKAKVKSKAKKKRCKPGDPWECGLMVAYFDGNHNVSSLSRQFGHTRAVILAVIKRRRHQLELALGDVAAARNRYIEGLHEAEDMAMELWREAKGNARASGLKQLVVIREKLAAACGCITERTKDEGTDLSGLLRNLVDPEYQLRKKSEQALRQAEYDKAYEEQADSEEGEEA